LKLLTRTVLETALEEELTEHLGYDKHAAEGRTGGNSRNGKRTKTVVTDAVGQVEIEVPRDRDGTFAPVGGQAAGSPQPCPAVPSPSDVPDELSRRPCRIPAWLARRWPRPRWARRIRGGVPGDHGAGVRAVPVRRRLRFPHRRGALRAAHDVGEVGCCDPFAWMDAGLTTNRGVFFLGQPGTGKSSGGKRICRGLMAFGAVRLFLGDAKPDYTRLVRSAGGWVIRIAEA
jgi:hypothetical protein